MIARKIACLFAATWALAACAADNPDNIPLRGEWEMTTTVTSLSVDGRYLSGDQLPPEFKALETTEKRCGEPMFDDPDWQESDINRRVAGSCRLTRYDIGANQVIGEGKCEGVAPDADFNPALRLNADVTPDYFRLVLTLEGGANLPGVPGRPLISATAVQEGRRLGDC